MSQNAQLGYKLFRSPGTLILKQTTRTSTQYVLFPEFRAILFSRTGFPICQITCFRILQVLCLCYIVRGAFYFCLPSTRNTLPPRNDAVLTWSRTDEYPESARRILCAKEIRLSHMDFPAKGCSVQNSPSSNLSCACSASAFNAKQQIVGQPCISSSTESLCGSGCWIWTKKAFSNQMPSRSFEPPLPLSLTIGHTG